MKYKHIPHIHSIDRARARAKDGEIQGEEPAAAAVVTSVNTSNKKKKKKEDGMGGGECMEAALICI